MHVSAAMANVFQSFDFASTLEAIAQRQQDGMGDPQMGAQRVFRVLNVAFPTLVFSGVAYALLVDKIFGLPSALARMVLPQRLHGVVGMLFRCTVPFGWAVLHTLLFATCVPPSTTGPIDAVCRHDPLARRWCVVSSVATAMLLAMGEWFERSMLHFVGLKRHTSFFQRAITYASICVAWLGLSERDSMSIVLLGLISIRKLRWAPIGHYGHTAVGLYVRALKVLILVTGFLGVRKNCPSVSEKHGVGATLVGLAS